MNVREGQRDRGREGGREGEGEGEGEIVIKSPEVRGK